MTKNNRYDYKEWLEVNNEYRQLERYIQQNSNMDKLQAKVEKVNKECNSHMECGQCVKNSKCGWCPMIKECVLGNKDGPFSGVC